MFIHYIFKDSYIDYFSSCLYSPTNFELNMHSKDLRQRISVYNSKLTNFLICLLLSFY